MTPVSLFPFAETWWVYGVFVLFVLGMLALDLGVFHRKAHAVGFREAAAWSVAWVFVAMCVGAVLYLWASARFAVDERLLAVPGFLPDAAARQVFLEYLTGYLVEKALSVDNIFVFVVLFNFFGVPAAYQHRVLYWGILGALVFRAIFIALGALLLQFHWVMYVFGAFLVVTGIKILFSPDKPVDPADNVVLKALKRWIPLTHDLHGPHLFAREGGRLLGTPLLLALVFIEVSDVVFAIDSVPAIFAITREPLVVFTSNICAILGLRALFFLLAGAVGKFHLLKYGLGSVLIFVGLKMAWLNDAFGGKFPIAWSLGIIAALLAASIGLSLVFPPRGEREG
ncbi:MAG: TerC/Alx family metal homeostasis membrane protein [Holophagales bacterium]|nr:TerC/Alx family metal homeostasis membrane protein [Holophagales bacterium]